MSFFSELRRRNVFRVTAAYLAFSWVVIEVTGAVVPALHLPDSIPSIVIWLSVIGFPFVVMFSWVYELTQEGLKRESDVDRAASITHITSKRLDYIIIGLMVLAIGLFVADRFFLVGAPEGVNGLARDDPTQDAASDSGAEDALLEEETSAPAIVVDDKSIAVLPFVNMSSDKEQEYFSDGMSEELLNLLSQVPDLKVIARTSSFAFKGTNTPIEEIARQLDVAHVLEGSVRKSGNTVRITAQLIRAADSAHLWSTTYDRPFDDIFAVQDEIAGAIVQALQIQLMGGTLTRQKGGTQNLDAYQLYLRGGTALNQNTKSSVDIANDYLEQAIRLDPNYGLALTRLAHVAIVLADGAYVSSTEGYERARQLAETALKISPDLAEAHAVLQYVYQTLDWDWRAAAVEERQALAIDPTNPISLNVAGKLASTLGQWDIAEQKLRDALRRDPFYAYARYNLGSAYYLAGRLTESEKILRQLLDQEPDFGWTRFALGKTLLAQDRREEALEVVQQEVDDEGRLWLLPIVLQATGHQAEADAALQSQIAVWAENGPYCIALSYAYRGERELALEWLERSYELRDPTLVEIVGEPLFKSMADDPRFIAFLKKMNLPTEPVPVNWQ